MSTVSIDIRRAGSGDAPTLSKVHDFSWRQVYSGLIPHRALETMIARRDEQWWAKAIRHSTRILVLEAMGEIVGYTTMGRNRASALAQEGEVYELYLLPEYQGVGLGRRLFLAARQELTNIGLNGSVVWVLDDNRAAVQFYQNAGGIDVAEGSETFSGTTLSKTAFAWV